MYYQQGDVIIKRIDSLPSGINEVEKDFKGRGIVLAEGEHTGHFHGIADTNSAVLYENGEDLRFLEVKDGVTLTHQEHGHINITEGIYEVGVVREADHLSEEIRKVQD
jgi:hypothetical protein